LVVSFACYSTAVTQCEDPSGNGVDWFLVLKYPGNQTSNPRFAYIDSNTTAGGFQFIDEFADYQGGPLYNTIKQINSISSTSFNLLMWNDEPPNTAWSPTGAHSKGVLAYDNSSEQGVYILHSAPKYPNVSTHGYINYQLPSNTFTYGQHFYCSTLNTSNFATVVSNLQVIEPVIYYQSGLFNSISFNTSTKPLLINEYVLNNGDAQYILSKNPNFLPYLYDYIMQPYLGVDLLVESWGRPYLPSLCTPEGESNVLNIDQIQFSNGDTWDHYSDHSKWAVTGGVNNPQYACFCDMNRMETQNVRGGSCICSNNTLLYTALSGIIASTDSCN